MALLGCKAYDVNYKDDDNGLIGCDSLTSFEPICVNKATNIELILIPAGAFTMGANDDQAEDSEKPPHSVTISKPFYIGVYETTKTQWRAVMGGERDNKPIGGVSWAALADANGFVAKLNANAGAIIIGGAQYEYALPSEAQWEYAARGASVSPYPWGDQTLTGDYAWYTNNSGAQARLTGAKKPNGFGLYDTIGNVAEWTRDCYGDYGDPPINECYGGDRVIRGGHYGSAIGDLRVSKRVRAAQTYADPTIGFRLALVPKP
ncbi:MAG: formylglycine-generating enzyme family protein [Helicobacteraceae bacterium]|jgi:formylglycine-generating enzyme required for sulfatase activity|nr:formylglycine-generating enzyme family protein [Helicobacteraceae bacterium]